MLIRLWRALRLILSAVVATYASVVVAGGAVALLILPSTVMVYLLAPYLALVLALIAGPIWRRHEPWWMWPLSAWQFAATSMLIQWPALPHVAVWPEAVLPGIPLYLLARWYRAVREVGGVEAWLTERQIMREASGG